MKFRGRLIAIGPAKFEAKRPWQSSHSHGYGCQQYKTKPGFPHALGHRPGELLTLEDFRLCEAALFLRREGLS